MENCEFNNYCRKILSLLDAYKWIYDFQLTEIFTIKLFEETFPSDVKIELI